MFQPSDLTDDAFLGGRLRLKQPRNGYRAGVDPVFLAAAAPVDSGETVLELGLGAGAASLCLGARVPGAKLTGLEIQPEYAALARANAQTNGIVLDVIDGDLEKMPQGLKAQSFDHVIMNPPYYQRQDGTPSTDRGRETALREVLPLAAWVEAARRRLKPGGRLTAIQRADRLPDLITACSTLGSLELYSLAPRIGRDATLVILLARKGGRAAFRLHAPLIMHKGERHERDGESYCAEVQAILRDGQAFKH